MRAVKNTESGVQVVQVAGGDDGVRVRVSSSGICGSDLQFVRLGPRPTTLGHEFAGIVDDGTPVAVQPHVPCGSCDLCTAGREHLCRTVLGRMYGVTLDGGMADEVWVDRSCVVPLPAGLSPLDAGLVEPIAVAVHCVNRAGVVPGQRVVVIGAGPIGLCAVAACVERGATVDVEARRPQRLEAAERLGAGTSPGADYDVVIDAAGNQEAVDRGLALVAPGGVIGVAGTYWAPVVIGVGYQMKEATIVPSFTYGHDDFADAARLLAAVPDLTGAVITHRLGLDDAVEAFRLAADHASGAIKVMLHP